MEQCFSKVKCVATFAHKTGASKYLYGTRGPAKRSDITVNDFANIDYMVIDKVLTLFSCYNKQQYCTVNVSQVKHVVKGIMCVFDC